MKNFKVVISTFVFSSAADALDAIAQARYRFMQVCKVANATDLARDASYDVTVLMCPKCYKPDCRGADVGGVCEKLKPIPVIRLRDLE